MAFLSAFIELSKFIYLLLVLSPIYFFAPPSLFNRPESKNGINLVNFSTPRISRPELKNTNFLTRPLDGIHLLIPELPPLVGQNQKIASFYTKNYDL